MGVFKAQEQPVQRASIICFGNVKGGSGKSTTAMHTIVALMKMGRTVGAIDLDIRQRTLSAYIENRRAWAETEGIEVPMPLERLIQLSRVDSRRQADAEEKSWLKSALSELSLLCDFIVIDSPGSYTNLSRVAHANADIIVTPMNDSFVDLDVIAKIDPQTMQVKGPSLYSQMIWESRKVRAQTDRAKIDWVLIRNRISNLDNRNKRHMQTVLSKLAPRAGFRLAPGFCDRVIYRELFLAGLTLLDLGDPGSHMRMTMSHIAARQEMRDLLASLHLPGLESELAAL